MKVSSNITDTRWIPKQEQKGIFQKAKRFLHKIPKYILGSMPYHSVAVHYFSLLFTNHYWSFLSKARYYRWAQNEMKKKGIATQWFAMDAKIMGVSGVSLAFADPSIFISPNTKKFLRNLSEIVLKENISVFDRLVQYGSFKGKKGGTDLDSALLLNEQLLIQKYLHSIPPSSLKKYLDEINKGIRFFLRFSPRQHYLKTARTTIGGAIDFGKFRDRMIIGEVLTGQMNRISFESEEGFCQWIPKISLTASVHQPFYENRKLSA